MSKNSRPFQNDLYKESDFLVGVAELLGSTVVSSMLEIQVLWQWVHYCDSLGE